MTETEIWSKWESQVVNGVFPLRRFLGRSNHSVVFLTDCKAQKLPNAAIKIIPADAARAETQLSRWRMGAALSHPHLIRLLEAGRCKLGGHPFLFVVTEYAEQNLAQILPHRALTADEVREMLIPTLDALAFLHRQNLVHGQLRPPNFLVVNDQLKLASDTIRTTGETPGVDAAADMLELGATIVEALTQIRPVLESPQAPSLPATLSPGFADALRRCLSPDPSKRPTVSELRDQIDPTGARTPDVPPPQASVPPVPEPPTPEPSVPEPPVSKAPVSKPAVPKPAVPKPPVSAPLASTPSRAPTAAPPAAPRQPDAIPARRAPWLVPAAAVGLVLLALWGAGRVLRSHGGDARPIADQTAAQQAASPATQSSTAAPAAASPVLHEELPDMSRRARDSIRGQIKVVVRVTVDRAGNVAAENLEVRGSSRYFARLATEAARKWKFAPADGQSARDWLVQFEFSRSGVTGQAVPRVRQ